MLTRLWQSHAMNINTQKKVQLCQGLGLLPGKHTEDGSVYLNFELGRSDFWLWFRISPVLMVCMWSRKTMQRDSCLVYVFKPSWFCISCDFIDSSCVDFLTNTNDSVLYEWSWRLGSHPSFTWRGSGKGITSNCPQRCSESTGMANMQWVHRYGESYSRNIRLDPLVRALTWDGVCASVFNYFLLSLKPSEISQIYP